MKTIRQLPHAYDRAYREVARWLREYARAELRVFSEDPAKGASAISKSVALICRNLAASFESKIGTLSADLAVAEQRVIAAARDGHPRPIRDALTALDQAQAKIDEARRHETMRRLADPR